MTSGANMRGVDGGAGSGFETFLEAMSGGSLLLASTLARIFPSHAYRTVIDISAAQGCVPVEIARMHPHLGGGGFDLPQVEPEFTRFVRAHNMEQRLRFYPGDFLTREVPPADVHIMGRILHNWDLPTKMMLLGIPRVAAGRCPHRLRYAD